MNKLRKVFLVVFSFLLLIVILNYALAKETEAWKVGTSSKKLEMTENTDVWNGETIRNIMTAIDEDELNILEDGSIANEKGTAGYNQYINFEDRDNKSGFVKFLENDDDVTGDFLYFQSGSQIARYSLEFKTSFQSDVENGNGDKDPTGTYLGDFEGTKIKILGKEYDIIKARRVTSAGNSIELTLMGDSIQDLLEEKSTKTYNFNGKSYSIEVVVITNSAPITVKFRVNGELLRSLSEGQDVILSDGTIIGVNEILLNDGDNESDYVEFLLGKSRVYLKDTNIKDTRSSNALEVGSEKIDDVYVIITGSDDNETFSIDTIQLNITADDDYHVAAGHSLTEYMEEPQAFLESWDIKYMGLSNVETETYKIKTNGSEQYELEFINKEGNSTTIPILYATGDSNIKFAHDDNTLILNTSAGMKIELNNKTESNYVSATFSTPDELDYDNIVPTPIKLKLYASDGEVRFVEAGDSTINWVSPSEEKNLKYAYTSLGAKFKWEDSINNPDSLTIEYPKRQRLPWVYIIGYQPIINFSTIDSTIKTFLDNSDSFYIVVGSKASAEDVIAATNIAVSFQYHAMQNCPATTTCELNPTKLDSEINNPYNTNIVSVGRPHHNNVTKLFLHSSLWPLEHNTSIISRFVHGDTATLVIAGNTDSDTRKTSEVIANFDNYNLNDSCFEVDTEDSEDLILSKCSLSFLELDRVIFDGNILNEDIVFETTRGDHLIEMEVSTDGPLRNVRLELVVIDTYPLIIGNRTRFFDIDSTQPVVENLTLSFPLNMSSNTYLLKVMGENKDGTLFTKLYPFWISEQCNDNLDNDNDGLIDEEDPGCWNTDGSYNSSLDDESIATQCIPYWILDNNPCLTNDKKLISYTDINNCNTTENLPEDNGTYSSCNYCISTWQRIEGECRPNDTINITYIYTNDCCAVTGLSSDCNIPENTTGTCDYCMPNWVLNNTWSDCINNQQFKNYYDANNCNEIEDKPEDVYQNCSSNVTNHPPISNAGNDKTVLINTTVTLDGSASYDPDNDPITYSWAQTSGPSISLSNPAAQKPSFTPTQVGNYIFKLTVIDNHSLSSNDSVTVNVEELPPSPPPTPHVVTSNLTISDLDVKVGDKTHKDLSNGATISRKAKPGDKVKFDVEVENKFSSSSDIQIEGIELTVTIKDIDDGDDLEESVDIDDLDAGDDDSATIEFTVPTLVDEGTYDVSIEVDGEDDNGKDQGERWELKLEVKKDKHDLLIQKADLSPLTVECNRNPSLDIKVVNIGSEDEDDVRIAISNDELGLNIEENNIELEEGSDEDSVFEKTYNLKIDDKVEEGTYQIAVKAYYDSKASDEKTVDLIINKCAEAEEAMPVEAEPVEIITPTKPVTTPLEPSVTEISFTNTPGFIAVLLFIFIILLGLVISAFVYITILFRK